MTGTEQFENHVAIVTGGGSGIVRQSALGFATVVRLLS